MQRPDPLASQIDNPAKGIQNAPKVSAIQANSDRVDREVAPSQVVRDRSGSHLRQLGRMRVDLGSGSDQIQAARPRSRVRAPCPPARGLATPGCGAESADGQSRRPRVPEPTPGRAQLHPPQPPGPDREAIGPDQVAGHPADRVEWNSERPRCVVATRRSSARSWRLSVCSKRSRRSSTTPAF